MRALLALLLLLTVPALAGTQERSTPSEPTDEALALVESYGGASEIGRDRNGNLWIFDRKDGRIDLISPLGERLGSRRLQVALAVDADSEWGIAHVSLMSGRRMLEITPWSGRGYERIRLPYRAGEVRWVGTGFVAIAPVNADHRFSIWSVESGKAVATVGTENPVGRRDPGLVVLRRILLRYCPSKARIFTLDSSTGELEVYTFDGALTMQTQLETADSLPPNWFEELDQEARQAGKISEISFSQFPAFDLDTNCRILIMPDKNSRTLSMLDPTNGAHLASFDIPRGDCFSRAFTRWGPTHLVQYRAPDSVPAEPCVEVKRKSLVWKN